MTESKVLTDENGKKFSPVVHLDSIYDGDGTPLRNKLFENKDGNAIPDSLGVLYCLKKAQDLIKISQYIRATLNVPQDPQVAGDTLVGMPYSSTRKTNTIVPNNTSLLTYLSALFDANSYAYTETPGISGNANLYYGIVCMSFGQYCVGIDIPRHTNLSLFGVPGIEQVEIQDAQSMQLGYIINCAKNGLNHCMVCTGIYRDKGVITQIKMSESVSPVCREVTYTAEEFNTLLSSYTILKYTKIDSNYYNQFVPSELDLYNNKNIQTKKGTKSLWGIEESVVIDIIDRETYTQYKLIKNGANVTTQTLPVGNTIDLGVLGYGKYSLCLTDGTNESPIVEWMVVDYNVVAQSEEGGIINVAFSSKNAVPIAITWSDNDYMMRVVKEVGTSEIIAGEMNTFLDKDTIWANHGVEGYAGDTEFDLLKTTFYDGVNVYIRMMFRTEYGIYTTPMPTTPVIYHD